MSPLTPRIKPLDQLTINKIAAGEIIHRPVNCLKELLENSLDASSTVISIVIAQGGLKQLSIQDNGHGIDLDDYPMVCTRFATSKITSIDCLNELETFGFRGEALASCLS
jgi:DNA mismatch repair protein MLH1